MGQYDKAIAYHKHSLSINKASWGDKHVSIGVNLNNIGVALRDKGQYDEALIYLNQSYEMLKELLGEKHPNIKIILENIEKTNEMKVKDK